MFRSRRFLTLCLFGLAIVMVGGCAKVTASNYEKIENGMTVDEVKKILGEPTKNESAGVNVGGVELSGGAMEWVDGDKSITITFAGGKVTLKASKGL